MGAIMGAWGQIYEVYDWVCAHVPLLHWEHNYHGGHYRVCSHVITQSWGYSMALARWSNVTHGTQPQIHRAIGIFLGMVSTNFTHLWWNWGWLMIGFTTLEIISLKSHRTPKMMMMMMMIIIIIIITIITIFIIIIIITENLFLAIFWGFHMSACRRVGFSN